MRHPDPSRGRTKGLVLRVFLPALLAFVLGGPSGCGEDSAVEGAATGKTPVAEGIGADPATARDASATEVGGAEGAEGFDWLIEHGVLFHAGLRLRVAAPEGAKLRQVGPAAEETKAMVFRMSGPGRESVVAQCWGASEIGYADAAARTIAQRAEYFGKPDRFERVDRRGIRMGLAWLPGMDTMKPVALVVIGHADHLLLLEVIGATEDFVGRLLDGISLLDDDDCRALRARLVAGVGVQEEFDLERWVHHREAGHYASGLGLEIPGGRNWRIRMRDEKRLLSYEVPHGGISGHIQLVADAAGPRELLEGFATKVEGAKVAYEAVEVGGRTWSLATVATAPVTVCFAAARRGDELILLQHIADADVADLGRDDLLAFLAAVRDRPAGQGIVIEGLEGPVFLARASGLALPARLVVPEEARRELIRNGPAGANETVELNDGSCFRAVAEKYAAGADAAQILRYLFRPAETPAEPRLASEFGPEVFVGEVLHEDALDRYALRRIGSIWQGLRVEGTDRNDVSRRFEELLRYLRAR